MEAHDTTGLSLGLCAELHAPCPRVARRGGPWFHGALPTALVAGLLPPETRGDRLGLPLARLLYLT